MLLVVVEIYYIYIYIDTYVVVRQYLSIRPTCKPQRFQKQVNNQDEVTYILSLRINDLTIHPSILEISTRCDIHTDSLTLADAMNLYHH